MPKPRILFIDDDRFVRAAFGRALRGEAYDIDVADSAKTAADLVRQHTYAVIASDYRLADANGLEVLRELRVLQPCSTLMLVSGELDETLSAYASTDRITHIIGKPWDIVQLRAHITDGIAAFERSAPREA